METHIKKVTLSVRLRPATIADLDKAAQITGLSRSDLIRKYIHDGLSSLFFGPVNSRKNIKKANKEQCFLKLAVFISATRQETKKRASSGE